MYIDFMKIKKLDIHTYAEVESTNTLVKEQAVLGAKEGYTVIANRQTKGRGRVGRTFFSPSNTGLYMSLLLRPEEYGAKDAVRITTMAAVAVCEALEVVMEDCEHRPQIKWVNDIFLGKKKVCGILTEGSFDSKGMLEYAVLGIGINVYPPEEGFPEEIENIAGYVFSSEKEGEKEKLAAEVLQRFMTYYKAGKDSEYAEKYKQRNFVIGKEIYVLSGTGRQNAVVLDIDEACRLQVRYADGKEEWLDSGEISVQV